MGGSEGKARRSQEVYDNFKIYFTKKQGRTGSRAGVLEELESPKWLHSHSCLPFAGALAETLSRGLDLLQMGLSSRLLEPPQALWLSYKKKAESRSCQFS